MPSPLPNMKRYTSLPILSLFKTILILLQALTRKSEECQGLETRINQLLDMEQGLNERESISSRLNKGH
jgi:hypothetical protein